MSDRARSVIRMLDIGEAQCEPEGLKYALGRLDRTSRLLADARMALPTSGLGHYAEINDAISAAQKVIADKRRENFDHWMWTLGYTKGVTP